MKISAVSMLVFSSLASVVSVGNAMTMAELQSEYSSVLATCNSEAANLKGASRDSFVLKCRIEKTSPEAKAKSCEMQMASEISAKAQRDPELRAKWIDRCVRRWNPRIG